MGVVSQYFLQDLGTVPRGAGIQDEISIQESAAEYRFHLGDFGFEDVSVGDVVPTERRGKATPDAGSCGLLTRGDGHYNGKVLGTDGGAASALRAGNDTRNGPWICAFSLVRPTEYEWGFLCDADEGLREV